MRSQGTSEELEHRRFLAVQRVQEGYSVRAVARFFGVARRSVQRWLSCQRRHKLKAAAIPGRPSGLTGRLRQRIGTYLRHPATVYGFATERWTAPRIARLLHERLGQHVPVRTLQRWLKTLGFTPQMPAKVALERDEALITQWRVKVWPGVKKRPGG